jgi:hypothetical protein
LTVRSGASLGFDSTHKSVRDTHSVPGAKEVV